MPGASKINPDLQAERDRVEFNVNEFTCWYYNGSENVAQKRKLGIKIAIRSKVTFISVANQFVLEKYVLSDPELNLNLDTSYLSYKEKYEEAIRRNVIIYRKLVKLILNINGDSDEYL